MANETLEHGLRESLFRQGAAAAAYDHAREDLRRELLGGGMGEGEIAAILETFEQGPMPGFGNTAPGRPAFDHALRNRVSPGAFTRFVTALKSFRSATATAARVQETAFAVAGGDFVNKVVGEAENLRRLRDEVAAIARRMNPAVSIDTLYRIVGDDDRSRAGDFDPLRRVVAVALDPTEMDPRQAAYAEMWKSVQGLLSERERRVLETRFGGADGGGETAAAEAFVAWAAPSGRRKPDDEVKSMLAPFRRFFDRVANVARGRGFQTVEDIWRRAERGSVASRGDAGLDAIEAPDQHADRSGYTAMKASISRLTAAELAEAVRKQDTAIFEARKARAASLRGGTRALFDNAVGRTARGALHAFDGAFEDPFRQEDRRLHALLRGRVLLSAERTGRARAFAGGMEGRGGGPGPGAPEPSGLGPRGFAASSETVVKPAANDDRAAAVSAIDGARGRYTVSPRRGQGGRDFFMLSVDDGAAPSAAAGGEPTPIGAFGSKAALHSFVDAIDAVRPSGGPSALARRVADLANEAAVADNPNADVDVIRKSGLLDHRLDDAVAARDMLAFAFPLTTGDVVWQDGEGRWQAGSFDVFRENAARRRDRHLTAAVDAIATEAASRRADERRWLDVPPVAEAAAVAKGAQWDATERRFFAPDAAVARRTAEWAHRRRHAATAAEAVPTASPPAAAAFSAPATSEAGEGIEPVERRGGPVATAARNIGAMAKMIVTGIPPRVVYDQGRPLKDLSAAELLTARRSASAELKEVDRRVDAGGWTPATTFERGDLTRRLKTLDDEMRSRDLRDSEEGASFSVAAGDKSGERHVMSHAQGGQAREMSDAELIEARRMARAKIEDIGRRIEAGGRTPPLARDRLDASGRLEALDVELKGRGLRDPAEPKTNAPGRRAAADKGREL